MALLLIDDSSQLTSIDNSNNLNFLNPQVPSNKEKHSSSKKYNNDDNTQNGEEGMRLRAIFRIKLRLG